MKLRVELAGLTPLNGCRRCGEDFTSLRTFDRHQIVEYFDDEVFIAVSTTRKCRPSGGGSISKVAGLME